VSEESLFHLALEMTPAERSAFLEQACGGDTTLRAHLEALLKAHDNPGSFLARPLARVGATSDFEASAGTAATTPDETGGAGPGPRTAAVGPGSRVGPYLLLRQIGQGGMGTVFLAEQTHPVQRQVALKLIRPGMDSGQIIARFEAERQALALMDHPHIARVLDAGTAASGCPYFVMELVQGTPITRYCDDHRLSPGQRLGLFIPVCQAVQHAHQKGVIHRDLKPSNVLVARYDGRPAPKVIDFGVAKATGPRLTERTLCTELGAVVGTLEYMSPEQAELNNPDIDTRSDVYALGVLLYELLTGTTPLDRQRLKQTTLLEALRLIREEEPPRPSARLSTAEGQPAVAANRGVDQKRLSGLVRGELDWIVMKCLEKDRNRRYESANGLALDLERYLHDEPVQACPPSALYRFGKFARRNKGALLTLALLGVLLLAAVVILAVSNARIEQAWQHAEVNYLTAAAQRREAEKNFQRACKAVEQMLSEVGSRELSQIPQMEPVRRALLEKAVRFFEEFRHDPRADPEVRHRAGQAYYRVGYIHWALGQTEKAQQDYARCRAIYRQLLAEFPDEPKYVYGLSVGLTYLACSEREAGRHAEAERVVRQALALVEKLPPDAPDPAGYRQQRANVYLHLGVVLLRTQRLREAEQANRECLAWTEKLAGGILEARDLARLLGAALHNLATVLDAQGQSAEAAELLERAIGQQKAVLRANPWDIRARENLCNHYAHLGGIRGREGKLDAAVKLRRQAVDLDEQRLADFPRAPAYRAHLAASRLALGEVLRQAGALREAEALGRAAVPVLEQLVQEFPDVAEYPDHLACALGQWAELRQRHGALAEAEPLFRRAIRLLEKLAAESRITDPAHHRQTLAGAYSNLANLLRETARPEEAETAYGKAVRLMAKLVAERPGVPDHRRQLGSVHYNLAHHLLYNRDRPARAQESVELAIFHTEAALKVRPRQAIYREGLSAQRYLLNEILWRQKKYLDAVAVARQALPAAEALAREVPTLVQHRSIVGGLLYRVAYLQQQDGQLTEARPLLEKAVGHLRFALSAQPANAAYREHLRNSCAILTETLVRLRDHAEAAKTAAELPAIMPEGWKEHRRAAGYLAYCVLVAAEDRGLAPDERERLKQSYGDQAMRFLKQAVARGYKDTAELAERPFRPALGARADFRQLLAELKQPQP
jgi:serine/threonine protein kinase